MRIIGSSTLPKLSPALKPSPTLKAHFSSSPPQPKPAFTDKEFMCFLAEMVPEEKSLLPRWKCLIGASKPAVPSEIINDWVLQKLDCTQEQLPKTQAEYDRYCDTMSEVLTRLQEDKIIEKVNMGYSIALGGTSTTDPYNYGYILTGKGYAALKDKD